MIYNDQLNLSNYYGELKIKSKVTAVDKDIDIGDFHFEFLHLPGHTIGSCFITLKNYHVIFSGDVLFKNGIGRFDFPTSSSTDTRNSIKKIKEIKKQKGRNRHDLSGLPFYNRYGFIGFIQVTPTVPGPVWQAMLKGRTKFSTCFSGKASCTI